MYKKGGVMTPLQEIVVCTDKAAKLTLYIVKASEESSPFTTKILVFEPASNSQYLSSINILGSFKTAKSAFKAAFKRVEQFCRTHQHSVTHINNPCNCEFLSAESQQQIVKRYGVTVAITVNA